jgi:hypothetical protein
MSDLSSPSPPPRRIIKAFNPFHLGDNVYNMCLFFSIKEYLREFNIHIEYYFQKKYHDQVREFAPSEDLVSIHDYTAGIDYWGDEYGIRLHIGNGKLPKHLFNRPNSNFDEFYVVFYNQFLEMAGINIRVTDFHYEDGDLLMRYENLAPKYKDVDILIVNSSPCSNQYSMDKPSWDDYIRYLVYMGFKVSTTEKTAGVTCTADAGLTLKDIGAISTRAKVIIAINTGPLSACFNAYALSNMRQMYVFDWGNTYRNPKIQNRRHIRDISVNELKWLCKRD